MTEEYRKSEGLEEPSVLDYVKSLFRPGGQARLRLPGLVEEQTSVSAPLPMEDIQPLPEKPPAPLPWRSLVALFLALVAQTSLEPPPEGAPFGIALYLISFGFLGWGMYHGEWKLPLRSPDYSGADPLTYRRLTLLASLALALVAFSLFGDNLFTAGKAIIWGAAVALFIYSLWLNSGRIGGLFQRAAAFLRRDRWTFSISRWTLLVLAVTAVVFFFRFHQTGGVPPEPISDHAEKILDVYDVSQGQTFIFFVRNTGREAFQMYWTLLVANVFGTGLSFLSLKLGTAILGFLTLPFIYLLGKEIGGARVGLLAFLLAGIAYWPNVISRVGLRFPLYPLFAAPVLFFLIRGLRTRNRNDFLRAGLFLGIGLHGYSPMRIVPFVVVATFALYWLHSAKEARRDLPLWLAMLSIVAVLVFVPLLRYWFEDPAAFGFRALTRLSSVETPLPGPAHEIFLSNLWNGLGMFNFDDGEIWVHSVTHRPALDIVSGGLFLIGVVLVAVRYVRERHWLDLFLLVSIPLLMMPSILSLAYPGENPALNRAGGAYIPAFIICALALDGLLTSFGRGRLRSLAMWALAGLLLFWSASQNYDLVFNEYREAFQQNSWNTSDMGRVIREFEQTYNRNDTIWVVPYPHWVDTRLPAVWAGIPNRDLAVWRENIPATVELTGPKLFMVKAHLEDAAGNDQESLDVLNTLYPDGQLRLFDSDVPGHDFWIFTVPQ